MEGRRRPVLIGVSVVLGVLVLAIVLAISHHPTNSTASTEVPRGEPVYFDSGTVFTPRMPPTDPADLTADEAWEKWAHGDHLTSAITSEYGVLNEQGRYHLVWGFSSHGCIMPVGVPTAREVALARSPKCRLWTFLNPRTGKQILSTNQEPTRP
jgi:hypothetical protein